jgi:hypothetical protein
MAVVLSNATTDLPDAMAEEGRALVKRCRAENPDGRLRDVLSALDRIQFQTLPQVNWPAAAGVRSSAAQNSAQTTVMDFLPGQSYRDDGDGRFAV